MFKDLAKNLDKSVAGVWAYLLGPLLYDLLAGSKQNKGVVRFK